MEQFSNIKAESSHLNINGTKQYDFITPNFLSNFFKELRVSEDNAFKFIKDYTRVPSFQYDNIIWGNEYEYKEEFETSGYKLDNKAKVINKSEGLVEYYIKDGIKIPLAMNKFYLDFNLGLKEGSKGKEISTDYAQSNSTDWKINILTSYLQSHKGTDNKNYANYVNRTPSDSGVQWYIVSKKIQLADNDFNNFINKDIKFRQSSIYKAFENMFMQDYTASVQAAK
jgi:hypothetical protein